MAQERKYEYLTRQERVEAANKMMEVLESLDTKDGDREREFIGILELVAKYALPYHHVKLAVEGF